MGFFSSIGNISTSAFSSAISEIEVVKDKTEDSLEEKELTTKIALARKEIEEFSLEPDDDFFNDTINDNKD